MQIVDLTHLNWCFISYGCYYKSTQIERGLIYYHKCSNL